MPMSNKPFLRSESPNAMTKLMIGGVAITWLRRHFSSNPSVLDSESYVIYHPTLVASLYISTSKTSG